MHKIVILESLQWNLNFQYFDSVFNIIYIVGIGSNGLRL